MRKIDEIIFNTIKSKGRLKKTFEEVVKNDLWQNDISKNLTLNSTQWYHLIHVTNPTQWDKIRFVFCCYSYKENHKGAQSLTLKMSPQCFCLFLLF